MIVNENGEMPLEWFLSDTNKDFPEQLAKALGNVAEKNRESKKVIIKENLIAFQRVLDIVTEIFEDNEDAKIEVEYSDMKLCYDILVTLPDVWLVQKLGDIEKFTEALSMVPMFGIDPIDNETIRLDFGSYPIFKKVSDTSE